VVGSRSKRSITVNGRTLPEAAIQPQEPGERRADLGDDLREVRAARRRSQVARRIFLFTVAWAGAPASPATDQPDLHARDLGDRNHRNPSISVHVNLQVAVRDPPWAIGFGCWNRTVRQLRLAAVAAWRSWQLVRITWRRPRYMRRRRRWRAGPGCPGPGRTGSWRVGLHGRRLRARRAGGTPASSAAVMKAWRSVWGVTVLPIPARRAVLRTIRPAPCRSSRRRLRPGTPAPPSVP